MNDFRLPDSRRARVLLVAGTICAAAAGAFTLWDPLDVHERAHLRQASRETARSVREDLAADVQLRISGLTRLASLIAHQDWRVRETDDLGSRLVIASQPGDVAFQWIDAAGIERWRICVTCEPAAQLPAFDTDRALYASIQMARARREAVASPAMTLTRGRFAIRIVTPALRDGAPGGFLVTTLDVGTALESMLASHGALGYGIAVSERGVEIFRSEGNRRESDTEWAEKVDLQLPGVLWEVRVWPMPRAIDAIRSALPEVGLVLGALLGALLFSVLYFARLARVSSNQLRLAHAVLEQRVEQRTVELQQANLDLQNEIAERARAEGALQHLSHRLLRLQEEERRRIARELHDSTGGLLTALIFNLELTQRFAQTADNSPLAAVVRDSAELLDRMATEIRTLSYLLHPPMLDELGLENALRCYVTGFTKRSAIAVTCEVQPDLCLTREVELTIFRVVQESLTNVHRHSGSSDASVIVWREDREICAEVTDRGRGIPADIFDSAGTMRTGLGVGIAGMRDRVRQVGGRFEMAASPRGTTVRVSIPVAAGAWATTDPVEASEPRDSLPADLISQAFLPVSTGTTSGAAPSAGQPAA
jgi:signal transduction histidine kinase